jgi:hypothetical protein
MSFACLSESVAAQFAPRVELLAADMDGTLTCEGKFTARLLETLERCARVGLPVLVVTGRSAGWVSGLVTYLPIVGAIAENGGLFYDAATATARTLVPIADIAAHRRQLAEVFAALRSRFPQLRESADNVFRLTDWTFDVDGLSAQVLEEIDADCRDRGWGFTYSSVQGHIKLPQQQKGEALLNVIAAEFPQLSPQQVLTVGDSPNDASLFDASVFPLSVGVANVREYRDRLPFLPQYVTQNPEGEGFCELAEYLIEQGATRDRKIM